MDLSLRKSALKGPDCGVSGHRQEQARAIPHVILNLREKKNDNAGFRIFRHSPRLLLSAENGSKLPSRR